MLNELSHWQTQRKSFTLMQGVILCGSLEFWANTSPWIRFLYHQLRSSVNKCLTNCFEITKNKEDIKKLITNVTNTNNLDEHQLQDKMLQKTIAKETYKCQHKTYIDKLMRTELNIMKKILSTPKMYNLETPIAHIINRDPDFTSYGDACLEAGGGYSEKLFWWHVEWPDQIKSLTIKNLTVTRTCSQTNNLVSINLLEFVVKIINYAAITSLFRKHPSLCTHSFPLLLNWTNNMFSKAWLRKAATRTSKGKALQRVLCSLMINDPVGIKADHIAGSSNILVDIFSRVYTTSYSQTSIEFFSGIPTNEIMEEISPESRVALSPLLSIVTGTRSRIMSTKQIGTLCSRQQHFIQFLDSVKLGNNYALKGFTLTTRNIIMACYTAYLATGETLLCKSIKTNTIIRYLNATAELSTLAKMINPCLDIMGNQSMYIKDII